MSAQLEADALSFAYRCHDGQTRKNSDVPYIIHPVRVALLVKTAYHEVPRFDAHTCPSTVIAAAFLHDVIEDCECTPADFEQEFGYHTGSAICDLVMQVTEVSRPEDGNRKLRKALDSDHYAKSSPAGATIKLADIIDNLADIKTLEPRFVPVYREEMLRLVPRLVHGHPTLYVRAWSAVSGQR